MTLVNKFMNWIRLEKGRMPLSYKILLNNSKILGQKKEFKGLLDEVKGFTVVGKHRCFWIWQLAKYAATREGDIAEVGVYKGGTARIIAKSCPNKKVHLFDTFSGMPPVTPGIDFHQKGDFSNTSLELVGKFLADCDNVVLHPGFFPETANTLKSSKICFVHIDVDIYTSVRDSLEFFYNKMVPGGIMVFDDYEWSACPGVKKAIEEFFRDKPEKPIVTEKNQCAVIKI